MAYKKWNIRTADKEKASELSEKFNMDPFIAYLLVSRGQTDALSVGTFIGDSYVFTSPFRFADMDAAAFTVGDAVDAGEKICIYGDYDCDGVTATALLYSYLKSEGADVFYYIPHRLNEGYGMNKDAIDKIKAQGADLIVTVDNGISSVEEAEYIYSLGMRLVVTDHHQLSDTLPRAEAVVNPHRPENDLDFRDYCGVGVAFKLICAMNDGEAQALAEQYMDLVAIGTVADVMPLLDENRAFVKMGLELMNHRPRPAIEAFKLTNGMDAKKTFTAGDITFMISPRINAMGRTDDAAKAVEFLLDADLENCKFRAAQLNEENAHRQQIEQSIVDDVNQKIAENPSLVYGRVIVIAGHGYHPGIVGLAASRVLEKYGKPTIVIGMDDDGIGRGSARSVEGFNIFEAISACSGDFIRFGGHPQAAGVTLKEENIDLFRQHINDYALREYTVMPPQSLTIDCKLSPDYLTLDLVQQLKVLEPCGASNPVPLFGLFNVRLVSVTPMGEGRHIRLELEKKGKRFQVVKFRTAPEDFPYQSGDLLNIAVRLSENFFREKRNLSVQAQDIQLSKADMDRYFTEKEQYERYLQTGGVRPEQIPSREDCAAIYRYLKAAGGYAYDMDTLYFRLQDKVSYSRLAFALKAFDETGLIKIDAIITLNPHPGKVDLEHTKILTELRERIHFD